MGNGRRKLVCAGQGKNHAREARNVAISSSFSWEMSNFAPLLSTCKTMNEDLCIRGAYAALIFIFLFCGVLRSCNLWVHAGRNMDELYPARRVVSAVYFSVLMLVPCVLHPQSPDARLLARCFWIVFVPVSGALPLKSFFYGDHEHRRLRLALVGGVPALLMLALSCIALAGGGLLTPYTHTVIYAVGALGVLLTAYLLHVTLWLCHLTFDRKRPADSEGRMFPRRFALGIFWVPMTVQAAAWAMYVSGNPYINALFTAGIVLAGSALLVIILHPQRVEGTGACVADETNAGKAAVTAEQEVPKMKGGSEAVAVSSGEETDADEEDWDGMDEKEIEERAKSLSQQLIDRIEGQIRNAVERDRMFLDPDLSKGTLASLLGVNGQYLHVVLRLRFGRFNRYVNVLRLKYAMQYEAKHPDAKREETARKCGFGCVRTYYRAKKEYQKWLSDDTAVTKSELADIERFNP